MDFQNLLNILLNFLQIWGYVTRIIFTITDEQKIMDVIQDKNICYEITQHEFNPKNQLKLN